MKSRRNIFLISLLIVLVIGISAVNAAENSSDDIQSNDYQDMNLEENAAQEVSSGAEENQEIAVDEKNVDSKMEEKMLTSGTQSEAPAVTKKASSKDTSDFKTVTKNSKDKAMVKKIQKALKKNGYYLRYKGHYLKVDGWYGPYTFKAVKQFQKAKGLKATGNVDEKTALKLKIIDNANAVIKLESYGEFKREYNSGKAFEAKIVNKTTGKGIKTVLKSSYYKKGKYVNHESYYTGKKGENYITPDGLGVGSYKAVVQCNEPGIKADSKSRTVTITKTSIKMKADKLSASSSQYLQLKAKLTFKNNREVNEGKVKFTIDCKSYTVKVKNGIATKKIKLGKTKAKTYKVEFIGNKNIKAKTVYGKIA